MCIGVLFGETLRPGLPRLTVRAKLGGKVLGFIDMLPTDLFAKAPLCMVEKLQSQASKLLVHPCRPARYLMVFVDQLCLTGSSFAFTKQLGFELVLLPDRAVLRSIAATTCETRKLLVVS